MGGRAFWFRNSSIEQFSCTQTFHGVQSFWKPDRTDSLSVFDEFEKNLVSDFSRTVVRDKRCVFWKPELRKLLEKKFVFTPFRFRHLRLPVMKFSKLPGRAFRFVGIDSSRIVVSLSKTENAEPHIRRRRLNMFMVQKNVKTLTAEQQRRKTTDDGVSADDFKRPPFGQGHRWNNTHTHARVRRIRYTKHVRHNVMWSEKSSNLIKKIYNLISPRKSWIR